jgi:acetylglutamate kinase
MAQPKDVILIKIGGSLAADNDQLAELSKAIAFLVEKSYKVILVHGGGKDINENLKMLDEVPEFVNGLRVTDENVLKMVEMTLCGTMNKKLVRLLQQSNCKAVGISGQDGQLLIAQKKLKGGHDIGFVGEVTDVNTELVDDLLKKEWLPIVSPLSVDVDGNAYNVNADEAASALARALNVDQLLFISDVPGVLNREEIISYLNESEIDDLIESKVIQGGMIPKVESCLECVHSGIKRVHILGWKDADSLEQQIMGKINYGTIIS